MLTRCLKTLLNIRSINRVFFIRAGAIHSDARSGTGSRIKNNDEYEQTV
jgi:hypothetical protein